MGIPIDDPETRSEAKPAKPKPSPTPEPEEEDYFYRPAPRNTYTPTQEQITQSQTRHDYKRWGLWGLWGLLGVLGLGLLIWLLARGGGQSEEQQEIAVADTVQVTETGELAQVTEDEQKAKDLEAEKKAQEEKAREEKAKEEKAKAEKAKAEAEKAEAERLKAEKAKAEAEKAKAEQAKTATEPAKGSHKVVTDVVTDKIVLVTSPRSITATPGSGSISTMRTETSSPTRTTSSQAQGLSYLPARNTASTRMIPPVSRRHSGYPGNTSRITSKITY